MIELVIRGITLGMNAGLSPGPLQTYIIQTSLKLGWRRSLIVVLSPLLADLPIILLIVFVLSQFPPTFIHIVQIVGGLFLLYLAWNAWKDARSGARIGGGSEDRPITSQRGILIRAVQVNFLSPGPYIFWGTINGPLLMQGLRQSVLHGIGFLLAFYGMFLGILCGLVLLTDRLRHLSDRANRWILMGLALILAVFGLSLIGQGLGIVT